MLEKFILQLSQEYNFPFTSSSPNQEHLFLQIEEFKLSFKKLDSGSFLSAPILPFPSENQDKILTLVMGGNFMGQGTGGAVIGLTEDESFLTLGVFLPYEISYKAFKESVEEFVNFLELWKKGLVQAKIETEK